MDIFMSKLPVNIKDLSDEEVRKGSISFINSKEVVVNDYIIEGSL